MAHAMIKIVNKNISNAKVTVSVRVTTYQIAIN